jgi:ABC-type transport system involved in multi-copper enzyme maturation permease subunit
MENDIMGSFFDTLIFLALSILISTIVKKINTSLLYNIAIWLVFTITVYSLISTSVYIATEDIQIANEQTMSYLNLVPSCHYALTSADMQDVVKESFDYYPKI